MGDVRILYGKYDEPNLEIDRVAHRDLLVKYDLQSFSELLVNYMGKWFQRLDSMDRYKKSDIEVFYKELPYKLKVSKILKMIISSTSNEKESLEVSFAYISNKINVRESNLIIKIKEIFLKEFERLGLNETPYTREEAIEELVNCEDQEWLNEYSDGIYYDGFHVHIDLVPEEMIEEYIFMHYKPREITSELVDDTIKNLGTLIERFKAKPGAKIKNLNIGELARRLSYLHVFRLFLDHNKYPSINDFPLSNETCRFIYEYFDFWDLLNEHVKYDKSEKEKRASYIKSLIRNNEDFYKKGIVEDIRHYTIVDVTLHMKIDLFKQVRQGDITPKEFLQKISTLQDQKLI